jgi:hypothetical protein
VRPLLVIPSTHWAHLWSTNSLSHTLCLGLHSSERLSVPSAFASIDDPWGTRWYTEQVSSTWYSSSLWSPRRLGGVSVKLSTKIVEEPWRWLWGVRTYLAGATKVTLVELRYWAIPYFLGSKIKSCLDRRASENLNSTSTWITVIDKSLIPREKLWCLFFPLTCLNCK